MKKLSFSAAMLLLFWAGELDGALPGCRRIALSPLPKSVPRLTWSLDGEEILVTDNFDRSLLRYRKDGRLLGAVTPPAMRHDAFKPTRVHPAPNGFLVQSSAYYWVWFDRGFKPLRHIEREGGPPRLALVDYVPVGGELFGLGTFHKSGPSWEAGILRVRLEPLELIEVIEEVSFTSKGGTLYTSLTSMVANAGGEPYMLRLDEPSYIQNIRSRKRLKAFPKGFETLPSLPRNEGPDSTVPRARVIEASSMPFALYGRGAFLYLLTRQVKPVGKTIWQLHRIDPRKDQLLGSVTLPSSASDLRLAPGPEDWAILEKGPVMGLGEQKVEGLLLIPASAIDKGGVIPACR